MKRWKTIAMMSMGFTCGVVWTAACGGSDSAKADDSGYDEDAGSSGGGAPPPSSHSGPRTVLQLNSSPEGLTCYYGMGGAVYGDEDCCPSGFTWVGSVGSAQVCLENG